MKIKRLIYTLGLSTLLFSIPHTGKAQGGNSGEEEVKRSRQIQANLDSLMDLWYVRSNAPARNRKQLNIRNYAPNEVPRFTDSVYMARIKAIESPLPYTYNSTVKAFIELYAMRKRAQVERMLGLSEYYFPIMEEILDRYKMPIEIKYLSVVESALNTRAVSRVGATGLWQFMASTGIMYNLPVNSYIDMRCDPVKSSEAAARYLSDMYHNVFKDWFLALAAYNCGPGNVNKAIRRSGGKRSFWEIYPYLPVETRGYVPAFIAASYVFIYHQEHNLYPTEIALPTLTDTVIVNREVNFATISEVIGIKMDVLRDLNPQYKLGIVPARSKSYSLVMPIKDAAEFVARRDSIYSYYSRKQPEDKGATFDRLAAEEAVPRKVTPSPNPAQNAAIANAPKTRIYYVVKSGDNMALVADIFDVSTSDVRRWNKLKRNQLMKGQRLTLYVLASQKKYYMSINNMTLLQKKRISQNEPAFLRNEGAEEAQPEAETRKETGDNTKTKTPAKKPAAEEKTHVVQTGETLWRISQKYPGVTVNDIVKLNGLSSPNDVKAGQTLKIGKAH